MRRLIVKGVRLSALALVLGLVGGVLAQQATTSITIWDQFFPSAQNTLMNEFIAEYQSAHPNVEIKRSVFDTDSIRTVLRPALASGQGPDIFYYDAGPAFLGALVDAGLVYDLTPTYEAKGWNTRLSQWAVGRVTYGGKIWGVPNEVEYTNVYVNKDVLAKLGMADKLVPYQGNPLILTLTSFDDFRAMLDAAKKANLTPIGFGNRDPGRGGHLFSYFVTLTAGKQAVDNILFGDGRWDSPEVIQALQLFKDFNDAGYYPPSPNAVSFDEGNALFFNKQALTDITGTWLVSDVLSQVPDPSTVTFFLLPPIEQGLPLAAAAGIGSTFAVSASSKHPDIATDFLDFIMSKDAANKWLVDGSIIPPISGLDTSGLNLPELTKMAIAGASLPHAYNLDVVMPSEWNDAMKSGLQAIITGQKTPAQVASDMEAAWETAKTEGTIWKAN